AQSAGRVAQLGRARFTRRPVNCCPSKTVKRSLGKGDIALDCRLNRGCVAAAASAGSNRISVARRKIARPGNEYFSVRVVCMAVEHLQGELHKGSRKP